MGNVSSMLDPSPGLWAAARELLDVDPERLVFWSGAGVSADAPTQGPLGYVVTDRAISQAFEREVLLDALRQAYASLELERDWPRLETVLDVVVAEHGLDALEGLLADLSAAPPNGSHCLLAEHTLAGGRHVTANFDTCIERAGGDPARIVHPHGSFTGVGSVQALGARLSVLERGFSSSMKRALDECFTEIDVLVVVGYSGLDYFDVDPYWREAAARGLFSGRRVVWVNHGTDLSLDAGKACRRKQLRVLADIGNADVFELCAPTREVLNLVAANCGLRQIPDPPLWEQRSTPSLVVSAAAKRRATTRFFTVVGLRAAARIRLAGHHLDAEEHLWAAEAAWAAGRYREAAWHWRCGYPGIAPAEVAARNERQAACAWMRGQLLRARAQLWRTLAEAEASSVDPERRLVIGETLGRVLIHMRRLPDTRPFVGRVSIAVVLNYLGGVEDAVRGGLGVHLRARVESVRADLLGRPGSVLSADGAPERDFDESEALMAMLNYEHARLRSRAEAARRGEAESPAAWEYVRHRDRLCALGAGADAARVPLLPGASRAFTIKEVVSGLRSCDFTVYHLLRLTVLYLLQRARGR